MSHTRAKPANWGVNELLTSAQMNQVDTNAKESVDNTAAGDTVLGKIQLSGAGRVLPTVFDGVDAPTTFVVTDPNTVIRITSAVASNRTYTLSATGAVTGDLIYVFSEPNFAAQILVRDEGGGGILNGGFRLGNLSTADGHWASFIYIGGWRLYQGGQGSRTYTQTFTSSGTFTVPYGVTSLLLIGCGGGGGGASGYYSASISTGAAFSGGGGGGGALLGHSTVAVTQNTGYTVTLGAGGPGGAGGATANAGGDGLNTTFGTLACFFGAQGGSFPSQTVATGTYDALSYGGACTKGAPRSLVGGQPIAAGSFSASLNSIPSLGPASGGTGHYAIAFVASQVPNLATGGTNPFGTSSAFTGGIVPGNIGITSGGGYHGGGVGGGGGAGPYGSGGSGVGGGDGDNTNGGVGGNGTAAAANTGAGGGGGSGGGHGGTSNGISGDGAAGGSGQLTVVWVK